MAFEPKPWIVCTYPLADEVVAHVKALEQALVHLTAAPQVEQGSDWFNGDVDSDGNELVTISVDGAKALLSRAYEVVHHDSGCPAIGGAGDKDCRCDAVPFLRDLERMLGHPSRALVELMRGKPEQPAAGDGVRGYIRQKDGAWTLAEQQVGDDVRGLLIGAFEAAKTVQGDNSAWCLEQRNNAGLERVFEALRTGLSDHIAKQVVPDGEVPEIRCGSHAVRGEDFAKHFRAQGFLIIRASQL